ncbi:hypothetical protein KKR91_01905 [Arthrobacter jiangjiafuii]|uniref:Uncharacterized protein n=1 Tax=Arthrobacter jiangjiafuii TaxID=2817475 RepID=A0A975M6A5_9MICC|nr:hypothetical protein [Arthrobacter jiangjiafuii]QWC10434.1 hypothetical protein KKR91_01905 [Arthrobacter jiangjiafuii]
MVFRPGLWYSGLVAGPYFLLLLVLVALSWAGRGVVDLFFFSSSCSVGALTMDNLVEMRLLPESDSGYGGGPFKYSVADDLVMTLDSEASRLYSFSSSRTKLVDAAKADFEGRFSEIFATNAIIAAKGVGDLAGALQTAAGLVRDLISLAREEDRRRRENNEYVREYLDRNGWEQFKDWWTGGEDRPNMEPIDEGFIEN